MKLKFMCNDCRREWIEETALRGDEYEEFIYNICSGPCKVCGSEDSIYWKKINKVKELERKAKAYDRLQAIEGGTIHVDGKSVTIKDFLEGKDIRYEIM